MLPTIGRIVHYNLSEQDAEAINRRRDMDNTAAGNHASAGQTYPAMVVATFGVGGSAANIQVVLDGNDTYWATSRTEGEPGEQGRWIWPPRV